jgi:tetratricopeptide (TPR) repeat protein
MSNTRMKMMVACFGLALGALHGGLARGQDVPELMQRSYDSEAAGKLQDAVAALDQLPQRDRFVVQLRRGWLLYRLGRHDEAVKAYEQAVELAPRAVEARVGLLLPQIALRRWADVEAGARAALKIDPGNYLANLRLAFACYNLHRYAESAALYRKLSELYPSDVEVLSGMGWSLLKMGKAPEAAGRFREVLETAPRHALAREGLKAAGG